MQLIGRTPRFTCGGLGLLQVAQMLPLTRCQVLPACHTAGSPPRGGDTNEVDDGIVDRFWCCHAVCEEFLVEEFAVDVIGQVLYADTDRSGRAGTARRCQLAA